MAKESRRKVKPKSSPPKYVSSDDEIDSCDEDWDEEGLLNDMRQNPKARIKGLLSEVGLCDEVLDQQKKLLIQEKESNQELKKLLKLEKRRKMRSLTKNSRKARRQSLVSRAQVVLFKIHMISCKRLIKILKCNLMLFGQAPLSLQTTMKHPQVKWV
jgi:hypothetical protein